MLGSMSVLAFQSSGRWIDMAMDELRRLEWQVLEYVHSVLTHSTVSSLPEDTSTADDITQLIACDDRVHSDRDPRSTLFRCSSCKAVGSQRKGGMHQSFCALNRVLQFHDVEVAKSMRVLRDAAADDNVCITRGYVER